MSEDVSISSKRSDKAPFLIFLFLLLKSGPDVVTRGRGLGLGNSLDASCYLRYGYMYVRYGCMDVLYVSTRPATRISVS